MKKTIALILLLFCTVGFSACGKQVSPIQLPAAEALVSVHISSDGTAKTYTDTTWMQELLSTLSAAQPTSRESVQDYPDAAHPMQIIFEHQDGGTSTVFAYEKNGAYYLEQPYQGIYQLTAAQYNWLVQTE